MLGVPKFQTLSLANNLNTKYLCIKNTQSLHNGTHLNVNVCYFSRYATILYNVLIENWNNTSGSVKEIHRAGEASDGVKAYYYDNAVYLKHTGNTYGNACVFTPYYTEWSSCSIVDTLPSEATEITVKT